MIQRLSLALGLAVPITVGFGAPPISSGTEAHAVPPAERVFTQDLHDEIAAMDDTLFAAIYDRCDIGVVSRLLTEDFEMYHDINGVMAESRAQLVSALERSCAMQRTGEYPRMRRELTQGTMKVYPVPNHGAIQVAEHHFYILVSGEEERWAGRALLTNVWKKENDGWKLSRSLSYDHGPPSGGP